MIWTAFIDETDSHGSPIMAMGGFITTAEKWAAFDTDWSTLLFVSRVGYSHAVDLIHKKRQFKGWDATRHNEFVLAARELMNKHLGAGFVAVLRRDDYNNYYKKLAKPRKPPEDTMYGVLFRACVSFSLAIVAYEFNEQVEDEVVNFVLEKGGIKPDHARKLYERFGKDRLADRALRGMLGPGVTFAEKRESPGCQAADLMLGGAIRQERTEHGFNPSLIEHSSFADVSQPVDQEDVATFRVPVTREVLESLRENLFVEEALRRAWFESQPLL